MADILIETLIEEGITQCFAVVGGGAMHIDNALALHDAVDTVFCHHEQACAMAAEAYAKTSGKPALVSVTSGPGGINALNGVQSAYVDNTPMIIIAGHPRWDTTVNESGLDLRYRGVQEFDIVPAVKGMTKYATYLLDPLNARAEIKKALKIAMDGRRGPVWISVPLDVQGAMVETDKLREDSFTQSSFVLTKEITDGINDYIRQAERPVILPGSGVRAGGETERFRSWVDKMNIPVVGGSLLPDIMYEGARNYYGTSGILGERRGNFILQNADLIIAIGNSLTSKQTGFDIELFAPLAKIIMIDAGAEEGKKPGVRADKFVYSDVKTFFDNADKITPWHGNKEWIEYCDSLKDKLAGVDEDPVPDKSDRVPARFMWNTIRRNAPGDLIIVLGNNLGMQNCIQKSVSSPDQRVILNYNCGSMGFDLPASVGTAKGAAKKVLCVTGDGSFMMNLQELQTIRHYELPVKIMIMSNDGYGAIRQTNKAYFGGINIGCDKESGVSFPDFEKIAAAFGFEYRRCENVSGLEDAVKWIMSGDNAAILEVCQKIDDPTMPKLTSKLRGDGTFETPALQDLSPNISEELMRELMPYRKKGE